MKIIIRDDRGKIKRCFIQVRDVNYLAKRFDSNTFKRMILDDSSLHELKNDDFFEVRNMGVAQIVEDNSYIVEVSDALKCGTLALSRMVVLAQSLFPTEKGKLDEDKKVEDLLDIINFKKGTLPYQIPVLFDGRKIVDDGEVAFGSTTLPGYYMLRSSNPNVDLLDYLEKNTQSLFESVSHEGEVDSYEVIKVDQDILVRFKTKNNLLAKLKKRVSFENNKDSRNKS